jgi:hypothetical protein
MRAPALISRPNRSFYLHRNRSRLRNHFLQPQRWQYCSVNLWAVFLSCSIFALRENEHQKKAAVEAAAFQTIIFSRK